MGWSSSAPTLPSGESWGNTKTDSITLNWIKIDVTMKTARGLGNTYYVYIKGRFSHGSNGTYYSAEVYPFVGSSEKDNFMTPSTDGNTKELYYTGTASSADTIAAGITVASGKHNTSNAAMATMTIPDTIKYNITYNPNGASGSAQVQSVKSGSSATLIANPFARTGYHFVNWNTQADGNGTGYTPGTSYKPSGNVTLYAKWAIDTYTISYNANGGTGAPSAQTKTYNVALTLSTTRPTWTGHTFLGWATSASATTATYAAGGSYTANASATLYAVWQLITYTVSYNGNGSTGGSTAAQTKTYDVSLTLRSNGYTRTGYTFVKWNTKADGSGTSYNAGAAYTANAAATLYAIWTLTTYPVTYYGNGNTGGSTAAQTKTYGTNLTLRTNGFTKTGYTFVKWNTKADGTGTSYNAGATYTGNAALTLYAIWQIVTYTVSYNANGGSGAPAAQTKTYGVNLTLSSTIPTRSGYTFLRWNTKADGTGTNYGAGASYTANAAVTLYAQWLKSNIPVYTAVNGQIRQVEKAYTCVNNQIKEVTIYTCVNNQIKTLV